MRDVLDAEPSPLVPSQQGIALVRTGWGELTPPGSEMPVSPGQSVDSPIDTPSGMSLASKSRNHTIPSDPSLAGLWTVEAFGVVSPHLISAIADERSALARCSGDND